MLVLIEVRTRLPLAMTIDQIQAYEGAYLMPLIEQAQANLGDHARITKVVADRGYLDGEDLWALDQRGIIFVVVAKDGMHVRADAQALARTERPVERRPVVRHGHGRTARTETLVTRLVGITGLTSYDAYGTVEHAKRANRSDFVGNPLNAVVVLILRQAQDRLWDNRAYPDGGTVYLTNGPVAKPFVVFDDYDWRSVIENGIFKEGKHPWHLEHAPQKTEAAVVVHCYFTLITMALCTAFRLQQAWEAAGAEREDAAAQAISSVLLGGEGTARWRRRLKEENRDKVILRLRSGPSSAPGTASFTWPNWRSSPGCA